MGIETGSCLCGSFTDARVVSRRGPWIWQSSRTSWGEWTLSVLCARHCNMGNRSLFPVQTSSAFMTRMSFESLSVSSRSDGCLKIWPLSMKPGSRFRRGIVIAFNSKRGENPDPKIWVIDWDFQDVNSRNKAVCGTFCSKIWLGWTRGSIWIKERLVKHAINPLRMLLSEA